MITLTGIEATTAPNVFADTQRDIIARMDETAKDIARLSQKIAEARGIERDGTSTGAAQGALADLLAVQTMARQLGLPEHAPTEE
jgi:hypothetical protein